MLKGSVRLDNPCRSCKYRHINCHSNCFMYKEWKAQIDTKRESERVEKERVEFILPRYLKRRKGQI